ncbi:MAG: hypothetical protein F4139_12825 [Gemmatimonadetes bacterium]|nr:hypothetical protein [Gemmatimonadota bacterium]MYH53805.1 hypothetical protein [Gemmatimonadota bacterium]MYK65270.1 hypothetical protein [Gemmatimonadota bacterium]
MYRLSNSPLASTVSRTPRKLDQVPSSPTKNPESTSLVASSSVTTRSHDSLGTHSCVEASWVQHLPRRRPSLLNACKEIIKVRLEAYPDLSAVRLFEEIREAGYEGGYDQVRRHVREVRPRP